MERHVLQLTVQVHHCRESRGQAAGAQQQVLEAAHNRNQGDSGQPGLSSLSVLMMVVDVERPIFVVGWAVP